MATRAPGARQQGILTPPAKYQVDRTTGSEVMGIFLQTTQLAAMTLTSDPSDPSDPLTLDRQTDGRTDRQTDGQHRYMMGPPSRKDGPIIM